MRLVVHDLGDLGVDPLALRHVVRGPSLDHQFVDLGVGEVVVVGTGRGRGVGGEVFHRDVRVLTHHAAAADHELEVAGLAACGAADDAVGVVGYVDLLAARR